MELPMRGQDEGMTPGDGVLLAIGFSSSGNPQPSSEAESIASSAVVLLGYVGGLAHRFG